ncbi:MAG: metal-dependent hydrolase [Patescibacteria group bacterium]
MDILAHTLWAGAGARVANAIAEKKNSSKQNSPGDEDKKFHVHIGWTAFFGVFPDLFAFTIPFLFRFYLIFIGKNSPSVFFSRTEGGMGGAEDGLDIAHTLYQYSHSLVIWAVVFIIVWIYFKRPRFELLGWILHILIDIPSHLLSFYPTPFLFPISNYKFPYGIQWSNQWFMIINYGTLLLVWGRILIKDLFAKKALKI